MTLNILTVESAKSRINDIDNRYIGVEVDYIRNANATDTLVRVFADNDYDDGHKKLITEFYMTENDFEYLLSEILLS